jgi:predicted ribosomally synthesized peptide with SipW-like signal peptide
MFQANSRSKKVLLSMGVLAGIGALAGAGTFASFTAQTTNPGNTFASGTLVLSDTVNTGTACLSTAGGTTDTNLNSACTSAFNVTVSKPGDTAFTNLTIDNMGSLPASAFKVFSTACTPSDAVNENYHGTGDPCDKVQIYIQRYSDLLRTAPLACVYGAAVTAATCDFTGLTKTLTDFVSAGSAGYSAGGLLAASGAATTDTGWFTVGLKFLDADNTFQGRTATLDLNWNIVQ